jgi:hypothetical protein
MNPRSTRPSASPEPCRAIGLSSALASKCGLRTCDWKLLHILWNQHRVMALNGHRSTITFCLWANNRLVICKREFSLCFDRSFYNVSVLFILLTLDGLQWLWRRTTRFLDLEAQFGRVLNTYATYQLMKTSLNAKFWISRCQLALNKAKPKNPWTSAPWTTDLHLCDHRFFLSLPFFSSQPFGYDCAM